MRLKTEVIIGTVITLVLMGFGYMEYANMTRALTPPTPVQTSAVITPSDGSTPSPQEPATITLTASEVAKHNAQADCWLIMGSDVYDVTNYLRLHPGGVNRITPYCGKDATQAYATQGGEGSHSNRADQQKDMLKIGTLNASVDTKTIQNVEQNTMQQIPSRGRREFDDD